MVFSTHRGHGHALAKGVEPRDLAAELLGRATGCSNGRGGSMHLFAPEVGLMGTSGIVGPCILQAAGAGYSFKLLESDRVAVAFFGDGAVNNGAFHEGLNMASIWKLPVLFVCENNEFATEVPFQYASGQPSVAGRAEGYGLPGIEVNGNDVMAVWEAAQEAVGRARSGGGATLIECKTYRTRPHAEGMGDYTYRSREDVERWKARCPIQRLRKRLLDDAIADEAELAAIDEEVESQIVAALEFSESSPWPDPATAADHVYAGPARQPVREVPVRNTPPPAGGRELTYMKATLEALTEEMAHNPRIFVMGEGIGKRGGNFATTTGLFDRYGPVRLCDTPICERGFVGLACGAAMTGTRPMIDFMFADFVLDSVGEILNQIAKMQYMSNGRLTMPVLLRGCVGIGHSAATHHSGNYYAMYGHFPGLRVVLPSTPYDAKGLLKRALRCDDPVLFLEHREVLGAEGSGPGGGIRDRVRPGGRRARGDGRHRRRAGEDGPRGEEGRRDPRARGDLGRAGRPAHDLAARLRDDPPIGPQDGASAGRQRGLRAVRRGRRDRGPDGGRRLRRPGRADPTDQWGTHADPLQPLAGGRGHPRRRRDCRRRPRPDPGVNPPPWP